MAAKETEPVLNPDEDKMVEEEIADLRHEIDLFRKEKERVRKIVGHIGGVPNLNTTTLNIIFAVVVTVCLAVSLLFENELVRLGMIELAVALVSVKLLILIHSQSKVNHLQLWILSSLEWRLDEIMKLVRKDRKPD